MTTFPVDLVVVVVVHHEEEVVVMAANILLRVRVQRVWTTTTGIVHNISSIVLAVRLQPPCTATKMRTTLRGMLNINNSKHPIRQTAAAAAVITPSRP